MGRGGPAVPWRRLTRVSHAARGRLPLHARAPDQPLSIRTALRGPAVGRAARADLPSRAVARRAGGHRPPGAAARTGEVVGGGRAGRTAGARAAQERAPRARRVTAV